MSFPPAPRDLVALLGAAHGSVDFLGRRSDAETLRRESAALAAGLARHGLRPGETLAVFLPNVPTLLVALFAGARLGLRVLLLDPREAEAVLAARLRDCPPLLLLTQNPAPLFDKLLRLLPACAPEMPVAVGRFTDLLPFPRNLLAPLLRGGGLATLPPDRRFLHYRVLLAKDPADLPAVPSEPPPLELSGEQLQVSSLLWAVSAAMPSPGAGQRWLVAAPLARREPLAAVLRGLLDGAELLLSPRLDRGVLEKLARQARPVGMIE